MFLGEYSHSLDAKGRLILPARFRDQLKIVFLTSEVDKCLAIWPPEEFNVKAGQMKELLHGTAIERNIARAFFSGAVDSSPDRQGRLAIPPSLRAFAGLDREVTVTGQFDHLEIWDAGAWLETKRQGEQGLAGGEPQGLASPPDGNGSK
ncbi:MAG TPA: division/cell wall cluster transcriptional repressor MraZ [Acidimicrobiales bacterium]|nr:division/cell wall cluster transcriptional repressor MraZ [Acidimicrobiales bacterium]